MAVTSPTVTTGRPARAGRLRAEGFSPRMVGFLTAGIVVGGLLSMLLGLVQGDVWRPLLVFPAAMVVTFVVARWRQGPARRPGVVVNR